MNAKTTPTTDPLERLLGILAIKRCHESIGEVYAVNRFLMPYNPTPHRNPKDQSILAYTITTDPTSTTLFSCHVDSVHAKDAPIENKVIYDANIQVAYKDNDDPTPLGADDGAGWWLLLEMIDQGVPGTYIFHRGEEKGGIGSSGMALHYPEFFKKFKRAIAFDRRGTTSIITHQGYGECCSDEFALALSDKLNALDRSFAFQPDDTGIYTDTAEYTHLISECTNVSCGYEREHTAGEMLDVEFLVALRDACVALDWESLPAVRTPASPKLSDYNWYGYGSYATYPTTTKKATKYKKRQPTDEWDLQEWGWRDLAKWCKSNPEDASDLLLTLSDRLVELQSHPVDADQTPLTKSEWDYSLSAEQTSYDY